LQRDVSALNLKYIFKPKYCIIRELKTKKITSRATYKVVLKRFYKTPNNCARIKTPTLTAIHIVEA